MEGVPSRKENGKGKHFATLGRDERGGEEATLRKNGKIEGARFQRFMSGKAQGSSLGIGGNDPKTRRGLSRNLGGDRIKIDSTSEKKGCAGYFQPYKDNRGGGVIKGDALQKAGSLKRVRT